jgi:RhtB (resistance to homoserine/threonine) family protein
MSAFLTIAVIHLLGVMSPGPDFLVVTRSALTYSRRTGIWTSLGIALGISVHIAYCLLGIGLVISQSIVLFSTIKYLGALYLMYIGWQAFTAQKPEVSEEMSSVQRKPDMNVRRAISIGFLTNALNPKASIFFLAVFTQVIDPSTPMYMQLFYGSYMAVATFIWFAFLASVLSLSKIKRRFSKIQHSAERAMGGVLILLGLKVALSSRE